MHTVAQIRQQFSRELILQAAESILEEAVVGKTMYGDFGVVKDFLRMKIGHEKREQFCVMFLNSQLKLISFEVMFIGTVTQTSVYPREVVRRALELNATSIILAHNHPSNETQPSRADESLTKMVQKACELVDVRILDHIVVGVTETTSFAEKGLI